VAGGDDPLDADVFVFGEDFNEFFGDIIGQVTEEITHLSLPRTETETPAVRPLRRSPETFPLVAPTIVARRSRAGTRRVLHPSRCDGQLQERHTRCLCNVDNDLISL